MSEKMPSRGAVEGHVGSSGSHQQRIQYDDPAFRSLVQDIMDLCVAPDSKRHELECLLNRHIFQMKQEGDFASSEQMLLYSEKRNSGSHINETGPRSLQLKFLGKICEPVFTGVPIKGENCQPLMVALVDGQSGDLVTVGPETSARVEIVALDPDLFECLGDSWTPEEFDNKIVTKEGNKRLLTGNTVLDLKEGKGCVGPFQFSHTKIWKTQRAYRLGARAIGDYVQTKIREGFTDSFFVKDRRLDSNRKHYPPNLFDEVWRLIGIAKDGAFHQRLSNEEVNIYTVEDLLKKLNTDPQKLRNILGKGMSAKMWEALVDHARKCIVDETLYSYSSFVCLRETSVIFNMVGQVKGLYSESQYVSFELLSESEKAHAMHLVASAFQQWDKVVPVDDEVAFNNFSGPGENVAPIMEISSGINILIPPKSYEPDLPQPATSFEDKASVFDDSPGLSSIAYPPKSPTMASSSGSKMIISPKICKVGFSNPVDSLDDTEFIFDESPSQNTIIFPPESSSATLALISQENNELDFPPPAFSVDEFTICSPKSPIKENCSFGKTSIYSEIEELDIPQPFVPSQDIIPSCDSVWGMSYYNDCSLQSADLENTVHRHVRHLSYSSQVTDSDNWEIDSMIQSFLGENQDIPLQFSVDDVPLQSLEYTQNNGNLPVVNARKRYLHNKAKRKWRILFSVIRWLFVPRKSVEKLLDKHMKVKLSSSYQDLQALNSEETKISQIRNLKMNSEANLHSAVNDMLLAHSFAIATNIAQRKYMPKRERAQRRWTKLYSVMKWFLVQRKVIKRASSALITRGPSLLATDYPKSECFDTNCKTSRSFACPFHEDEYIQMFNTICSLQPRNRNSMNKLARIRNIADRDFAKKKWRMLFSIMKWLSLRRSASGVRHPHNNS